MAGVFLLPRIDDPMLKQAARTTAFGTAGVSIVAAKGRLYRITFVNKHATNRYFVQVHDKASAPTAGNNPIWEDVVPAANGAVTLDFGLAGLKFSLGLGLAVSTTTGSLTLAASDDVTAYGLYASA